VFPKVTALAISTGLTAVGLRYVLDRQAAGYLPLSVAASHIERGDMRRVEGAPVFLRPVYLAYPSNGGKTGVLETALSGLRGLARNWAPAGS
jgi:DNA-binding transcriptional LysR family regulator